MGKQIIKGLILWLLCSWVVVLEAQEMDSLRRFSYRSHRLAKRQVYQHAIQWGKAAIQLHMRQDSMDWSWLVMTNEKVGRYFRKSGDLDSCYVYYQRALELGKEHLGMFDPTFLEVKNSLGIYYYYKGNCENALNYYNQVLMGRILTIGASNPKVAAIYNNMAICYDQLGDHQKALEYYNETLRIRFDYYGDCHNSVAASYLNLGVCYHNLGDYNKALDYYQEALAIWQITLDKNDLDFYRIYNNMGVCYQYKGDYERAHVYLLDALETAIAVLGDSHPDVARSFNNLGLNYSGRGDYNKALLYYQKALTVRKERLGEKHHLVARTLSNMANAYRSKGDLRKAYEYSIDALTIRQSIYEEPHRAVAESYEDIGSYYEAIKEYPLAIAQYDSALQINLSKLGDNHPEVSNNFVRLANCFTVIEDYGQALKYYETALEIRKSTLGDQSPETAEVLAKMANCLVDQPQKGLLYNTEALKILGLDPNQNAPVNISSSPVKALEALKIRTNLLIELYRETGEIDWLRQADVICKKAIQVIDWARKGYHEAASKQLLLKNFYSIYEQGLFIQHAFYHQTREQKYLEQAFRISEKSKNVLLLEAVQKAEADTFSRIPAYMIKREKDLQIEIAYVDQQLFAFDQSNPTINLEADYREQLFDLKRSYYQLLDTFRLAYPDYYQLRYGTRYVSINELQQSILKKGETLVEYFQGDTDLYVFVVNTDTATLSKVALQGAELLSRVSTLRRQIFDYQPTSEPRPEVLSDFIGNAYELYQSILAPLESIPETSNLIIVPDGVLGYLPFECLLPEKVDQASSWKDPNYLIHKFPISYSYAASLLSTKPATFEVSHNGKLLAMAPNFGEKKMSSGFWTRRMDGLTPLKYNELEAKSLHSLLGGDLILGEEATEARFRAVAGAYQILHLATHAAANDTIGAYSFLAFNPIKDSIENEMLFVKDLYTMELHADLVVLSACETGIGEWQRGEGMVSLGRGFLYAGAKSIVTTLWSIDDRSSSKIMESFYKNLVNGHSKDRALQIAKLDYLSQASPVKAHPFFWAAYIPVGMMSPIDLNKNKTPWSWLFS